MPLEFDNRPPKKDHSLIIWAVTFVVLTFISIKAFQYVQDHNRREAAVQQEPATVTAPQSVPAKQEPVALVVPQAGDVQVPQAAKPKAERTAPSSKELLTGLRAEEEPAPNSEHRVSKAKQLVQAASKS